MTGGFETSIEALLAGGAQLGRIQSDVHEQFEPVRFEMDSLLSGGWTGQAARGFQEGWQEWLQGFRDCLLALEEIGSLLGTEARAYNEMDEAASTALRRTGEAL